MTKNEYYLHEFDEWASLASSDPEAFEVLRRRLIERLIDEAPAERRPRLRCLQWRIEQERARAKSPLGACIRITRMMWDKVVSRGGLMDQLQQMRQTLEQEGGKAPAESARVLPFPVRR